MSADKRPSGGKRRPVNDCHDVSRLHIHVIPTMAQALSDSRRNIWRGNSKRDPIRELNVGNRPVDGDKDRLARAVDASEQLVSDAIAHDPRLASKSRWVRRDEGEHVDSGLIAEGDDAPFYRRTRAVVNDATMSGEPLRVVISTDADEVPPGTAAAFIAAARLVQQFQPLEIWWQGAWLDKSLYKGFVSLVPLVQGDMDFSRLEFCIADPVRDSFSFRVMSTHAVLELREVWNGCTYRAKHSHLPGRPAHFICHKGITPTAESVATVATEWLDWENTWLVKYRDNQAAASAAQELPPLPSKFKDEPISKETRKRWKDDDERREALAAKEARDRIAKIDPDSL